MNRHFRLFLLWISIFAFTAGNKVFAVNKNKFYAQGVAQIVEGNKAAARLKAVDDFKRQVMFQAVMEIVGPMVLKQHSQTVQKEFINKADDYIKSFSILAENTSEGIFRVNGVATVLIQKLQEDMVTLGIVTQSTDSTGEETASSNEILWQSVPACDLKVGNDNAIKFFEETLASRLAERGWVVLTNGDTQDEAKLSTKFIVKNSFICTRRMIQTRIEVRNADDGSVKGVISESVILDSETPVMESVLTLLEIVTPQLMDIVGKGGAPVASEPLPKTIGTVWTITIDSPYFALWEKIEGKLKEQDINFRIKSIVQDADSLNIYLEGVPASIGDYLEDMILNDGSRVTIEHLDPYERKIFISLKSAGSSDSQ